MRKNLEAVIEVHDDELRDCMRFFGERCKTISEPTGCLGLAGIKQLIKTGKIRPGQKCGTVITGGNIDIERYSKLLVEDM